MLPSLAGLSLNDEEPTGVSGGITKARDKRKQDKDRRKLSEAWEEADKEEAERARLQEMGRRAAAAAVDRQEPPGYPWRLMEARARERNEAAARLAAEQARDQAQQHVQALDGVRGWQQVVLDAQQRNLNEQSRVLEDAKKAEGVLVSRVRDAEARAEAAERAAQALPRDEFDSQGADDPMATDEDPPPYRGIREQLKPPTSDRIEALRLHLLTDPLPGPTEANPDLEQVLPMGFERLMDFPFVERGTEENDNNRDMSPAAVEEIMLERREKAWRDFITARDSVLNDPSQMRKWERFQNPRRPLKIPLNQIRWETEKYLLKNFRDFADKKTGGEDVALQYLNDPRHYPAIKAGLYRAMQEQHRSDGQTIFVRTEKVQAVYEAVLDFCQADLKYEVTLARRRTWAACSASTATARTALLTTYTIRAAR